MCIVLFCVVGYGSILKRRNSFSIKFLDFIVNVFDRGFFFFSYEEWFKVRCIYFCGV